MLKKFKADLHIHSCLSPCSDWAMSPKKIIQKSLEVGLDLIALCDHNSAENAGATMREGNRQGVKVLPGMEVCSKEEVHILALFDELEPALEMQAYIYANLPGENNTEVFGFQVVANEQDEVIGENPRLLIGATRLGLHEIVKKTHALGGINICCHVDRPAYGIINQLGFIPEDLNLEGLEVSYRIKLAEAAQIIPGIGNHSCVTSSDAHYLDDIGKASTVFQMAGPQLAELRLALAGKEGRKIVV
ncbi:MAG: PHP domain-containing protein [Desulfobacterales bacterium]